MEKTGEMSERRHVLRYSIKHSILYDTPSGGVDTGDTRSADAINAHMISHHSFLLQWEARNINTKRPAYNTCSLSLLIEGLEKFKGVKFSLRNLNLYS